ncbi:signal peptidase I [bacterium 210820-DFI.6.37]|nr:signal peptidase I [bacterium 210820-DFI.6.37]
MSGKKRGIQNPFDRIWQMRFSTKKPVFSGERPTAEQVRKELDRVLAVRRYMKVLRSTVFSLVVVAAVAVLISVFVMPVLQIYGSSMNPTLTQGDMVASVRTSEFEQGDLISFYYGNKLLVKRYIAGPGQWVDIDKEGNVYVDGRLLEEPYLTEKALGECEIDLPYQVPDGRIFVMGDHRSVSVDSRSKSVGCVSDEQIVGKIVFRIWPLSGFGVVQ